MAFTKEQWDKVSTATETLRGLGCAVCIFTPDDIESARDGDDDDDGKEPVTPERAAAWLASNRKYLEDGMTSFGNVYISENLDDDVPA